MNFHTLVYSLLSKFINNLPVQITTILLILIALGFGIYYVVKFAIKLHKYFSNFITKIDHEKIEIENKNKYAELNDKFEELENNINISLDKFVKKEEFDNTLDDMHEEINEKIEDVSEETKDLSNKLDTLQKEINEKLNTIEIGLSDKINDIESKLSDKIMESERRQTDNIREMLKTFAMFSSFKHDN